jgi:hypothetical protein
MLVRFTRLSRSALAAVAVFCLVASILGGHVYAAPTDGGGGVLTNAELKQCKTDWAGTYNLSKAAGNKKFNQMKKSDCYVKNDQGGQCRYSTRVDNDPTSDTYKNTFATVTCAADTGAGGTDGGSTGAGNGGITDPAFATGGCSGANCTFIDAYINPFIKLLSALVGIVAVIFVIFGAIQVSTSAGDPQKSANGKNHIRNAIIGMVAYVLLFATLNWLLPGGIN